MSATVTLNESKLKSKFPKLRLPEFRETRKIAKGKEVIVLTNGDLRTTANQNCWPVQKKFEDLLSKALSEKFKVKVVRAHAYSEKEKHGFIGSQREGSDVFENIDPKAALIVLLTSWQYSHHISTGLVHHEGPILVLANFDGTWPGLVGALNLEGTLTALGRDYSRLWSTNFDDAFFYKKLGEWLKKGKVKHDLSHIKPLDKKKLSGFLKTEPGKLGKYVGEYILKHKEIMGLMDIFCMGMLNGVFPQKALADIGLPMEGMSQSALLHEMAKVPKDLREKCLQWYIDRGMKFQFGPNAETDLTRDQVLDQCAMLIATARMTEKFGLSLVGIQYQQGLKDMAPASDFVEGAIGSTERFPIPDENGRVIRQGKPIPCANEVDMGTAIPQVMLFRLLDTMGLPSETTLHDVRWGSEYKGTFYWDFEISGSVPFEHLKGGIAGATGYRQPPMYFRLGGSTIAGQCKAGTFIWARAFYDPSGVYMHIGTGKAYELPKDEFERRLKATTPVWPLMNVTLDGVSRDQLMAGHMSNHVTVAYVPEALVKDV
ncbi:MAG: signal transduction protein, partial [Spirochaetia bacterium]|nr:signal transduction protein [Spirochaetia bacterium]